MSVSHEWLFNAGNNKFAHGCRSCLGIKMQFSNSVLKSNKRVRDKGGGKLASDLS